MRTLRLMITLNAVCLLLPVQMMASDVYIPTTEDVSTSLQAVIDATMSAVAIFLAPSSPPLPGCEIERSDDGSLPSALRFTASDLARYLPVMRPDGEHRAGNWLQKLLSKATAAATSPLSFTAASLLASNAWEDGDAILDGSITLWFPQGTTVSSLMTLLFSPRPEELVSIATVDLLLSGLRFGGPVHLTGIFSMEVPQAGVLFITPSDLKANGYACQSGRIRISATPSL